MEFKKKVLDDLDELQSLMILLGHADNDTPIKGKLKLQKIMFLLSDRIESLREQSDYDPDMLGPYSEVVDEESQYLQDIGIFTEGNQLSLTNEGKEIAKELEKKESKHILDYLIDYKRFLNDLTSNELLCYVYSAYPEMTDESVEYKRLLPIMEDTLLNLVKKQKISLNRAAELLNKDPAKIVAKLKEKGIKILS